MYVCIYIYITSLKGSYHSSFPIWALKINQNGLPITTVYLSTARKMDSFSLHVGGGGKEIKDSTPTVLPIVRRISKYKAKFKARKSILEMCYITMSNRPEFQTKWWRSLSSFVSQLKELHNISKFYLKILLSSIFLLNNPLRCQINDPISLEEKCITSLLLHLSSQTPVT